MKTLKWTLLFPLLAGALACESTPDEPKDSGGGAGSGGSGGTGSSECFENPKTHVEIINACTNAQKVSKKPELTGLNSDGSLPPP